MRARLEAPEPDGDRPAAFDPAGDVWQRQGPRGSATWYSAQPGSDFEYGRTWTELIDLFREMFPVYMPRLPQADYTTGSIPVVTAR